MFSKDSSQRGILLISISVLLVLLAVLSILLPAKQALSEIIPLEDEITFDLQPGWNLISMPFTSKTVIGETMMYSDLFELINQNGGYCQSILPYNSEENLWLPIYKHDPFTEQYNNELKAGHGYAIKCNGNAQIVLRGLLCKSGIFHFGSNRFHFIGPVGDKNYTAKGLSDELGLGIGSVIIPSDMEKQFRPDFPIFDFNLERGKGYFIKCATDKTWWYVESEGQPLYSDNQGIYIWQGPDGQWYIHLNSEATLSDNDMVNNLPINDLLISDPYNQGGAIIDIAAPCLGFLFPTILPGNIHVGLWGSSPDSSSFDLFNDIPSENVIEVILSNPNPNVNETFTADIVITNAQDVYSLNFHLRFDPDILTANQVTNGDFFTQSDIEFEHFIRNNDGEIIVGFTRKGEVPGISFSEETKRLLSIEFEIAYKGESLIGFEKECIFNSEDSQQKARWFGNNVKCDIFPLEIQIISPQENIVTNYPYMEVRVCTNTNVSVMVNGIKADHTTKILGESDCNYVFAARQIKLKPGKNHVLATGLEIDANDSVQIYYKGCDFAITSHTDGEIINNPNITISGTTDHLDGAVITVFNRSIDSQDNFPVEAIIDPNSSDCEFSAKGINLQEGENRIIVTKTEHSGSSEEREITIHLDTVSPLIAITSPRDQSDITFDTITDFKRYGILSNVVITNDGRVLLKKEDNRVFRQPYLLHPDNLNERKIEAMAVDPRNGDIWFSTASKKRYVISGPNRSDISDPITMFDDSGLPLEINVIAIDNGGFKWLGTNKGVLLYDNKDWYRYTIEDEGSETVTRAYKLSKVSHDWENIRNDYFHLPNNHIQSIYFRFDGIKWNYYFGTYNGLTIYDGHGYDGSNLYDGGDSHSQIITSEDVGLNEGLSFDIHDIATDDKGQLWIATGCGLLRYDTFIGWTIVDDEEVIDKKITSLAFDRDSGLWIGTEETGIYNLDQDLNYNNYNTNNGLSSNHIKDIVIDGNGIIWIANPQGVSYYQNNQWHQLPISIEGNEYTYEAYNKLSIDKEDNLWLGANGNGVIEYFRPYYSGPSAYIDIFYHIPTIFDYHSIQWDSQTSPDLTHIDVQIKSALTKEDLDNENFIDCTQNPSDLSSLLKYPWIQIRATLSSNERELTPELDAIIIRCLDKVIVTEDQINVSGFIKDSAPVTVMVNENEARIFRPEMDIANDAIFWPFTTTDINLIEGENIIKVNASDRAGNWDLKYLNVLYESDTSSNVSIIITSPVEGSLITTPKSIFVEGAVTGNNVRAFINDSEVQVTDGQFHTILSLAPENPKIKALAIDSAGYHALSEIMLHILEVTSPKQGQIVKDKNILIQGISSWDSDVEIAVSQRDITLDDIAELGLPNYTEIDPVDNRFNVYKTLKPGKNLIYLRQYFTSDYRYLKSEVIFDDTPPLILIDRTQFKDFIETWRVSEIISQDNIRAIAMDQEDDSIWIGTYGSGIKRYANLSAGTPIGHYDTNNSLLTNDYITDIHINDSYIWIATYGGGICRIRKEDDAWDVYDTENQLASLYVTCIVDDRDGVIWFGTSGGGISSYSPHYGWEIIKNSFNENNNRIEGPLPNNYIYCITVDRGNNKWIGASDGKMGVLKADNDTWEYFDLAPKRIWDTYVTSIEIDPNDRKWISLSGGGLATINKGNDQVFIYLTPENLHVATNEDFHPADHISTSILNIGGNVFYSDPNGSVDDISDNEFRIALSAVGQTPQTRVLYDTNTASYTMVASHIDDLYALNAGFIFSRITPRNDHKCLNRSLFDPNSTFYNDPNHILDPDLILHNENDYMEGGQASDDITHVFLDSQGQKWLVLRNGLTKVDTEGNWVNFGSVMNDMVSDLTISDYCLDDKKGILLFGTNKGLMILKNIYLIEKLPGMSHKFIDIEGFVRDDDSVQGITIEVDDSNDNSIMDPRLAEVCGDNFTATYIELADGWNEIKAIAEDAAGNLAHDNVTVFAGTRAGFIAQGSAYYLKIKDLTVTHEQDSVHISWDTLSSLSGLEIAGYDYLLEAVDANTLEVIDGNSHPIDTTLQKSVTFDKSGLDNGYFKFSVRAEEAGNGLLSPWADVYFSIGAISVKILDENILPDDIDPNSYRAILNYRIDYDEAADSNIILSCQYNKDGGDWITLQPPSAGMILISPLTEGIYAVQLTAENTSGSSTDTKTLIIDHHAPAIKIDQDIEYDLENDTVGLSWAGADLLMEGIEYQYRLDNGSWSDWSKSNSVQFDHIEPGVHTLTIMTKDRAYNISAPMAFEFAVSYDSKTPPDVKVIEGASGFINHNNVTFKWMGNDTITLPENILFSHKLVRLEESWAYDAELDNEGYDFLIDWDNPEEADTADYAYSWNNGEWVMCQDTNTICVGERFSLSHPRVIPGENLFTVRKEKNKEDSINLTQVKLFVNPTENGEIRNKLIYKSTDVYSWSLWDNALSANFSGLRDGRYCFYIRGKDSSGNISDPVGIIFTIDTMPPAVNIINVSPGNIAPEVQIEVKDEKERPAEVRINGQVINELPVIVNPASIKIIARYYDIEQALINKAANNHIIVTVTDLAGNVSTCEHNLDPIEIYSPDPNTIVTNSPITISGRINIENPSEVQIKVKGEINRVDARIDASGKFMADGIEIVSRADSPYENRIRIEVNDRYGHVITKSLKVFTKEGYLSRGVLLTTDPIDKNAGLAPFAAKLIARIPSEKIKMGAQIGFEWDFDGDGRYEVSKIVTVFDNPDDIPYIEDSETFTYKTMGFYHPRVRVDLNLAEATSSQFTDSLRIIVYSQLKNVGSVHDIDSLILDTSVYEDAYGLRDLYVLSETIYQEYKIEIYEIEENALNWADGIYNLHFLYNIQRPTAIHVAPNKDIYIVDQEDTSVKKLIKSGQTYIYSKINLRKIKEDESEEPVNLMQPFDLTLDDHGDIFLSDQNTVYQFKSNGELVCKLDKFTTERGEEGFDRITGIDFYAGYLWVIDQLKGQINKFIVRDNNLDYKSSWGASSNQETSLIHPFRSDFDKINGYIYIIDKGPDPNESFIKVYNSKGEFRFNIGDNFGISLNDPVSINLIGYSDTEKIFFIADNLKVDNKDTSEILSLQGDLLSMQDVTTPGGYLSHQKKIVFLRDGKLYVINDDGSDLRLIYTPGSLESSEGTLKIVDPSWYPDGTKIIFALYNMEKNTSDLCIYDLTKDELITLWHTNSQVKNPSFNRNGDSIVFACNNTPSYEYDLFTLIYKDGKAEDLKNITNSDQREEAPCWSPDGARIAFISNQFTNKRIFTVDRDGMDEQCLIDDEDITCEQPAWSNENDLAFIKTYTNESQEWVTGLFYVKVNTDGTRTDDKFHEIKTDSINIKHPSWDASGERITYISNRNIKVHDIQKNETVQITYVYPKEDQAPSYSLDSVPYFQARAFEITQIDCSWEDNLGLSYKLAYNKGQTGNILKSVGYMDSYSLLNLVPGNYKLRIEGYDKYQKKVLSSITQKVRLSHVYGKVTITQDKSDSYSYIFDASESIGDNLEYIWEIDNGKYTESHPIFTYTYKNAFPVDENGNPIPDEVFLTVYNFEASGELYEHRSGPYLIIIVEKDLEPVIDYEFIDSNSGTIIRFDASKSKGSRIDQGWSWWCYGDGDCGISPTLSIDHKYPTVGNLQRYWVQVTIRRQGSLGDPSPDQASVEKYIDLEGDELKAVINYRFSETNPGQIIFDAGQSLGSDIVWSNCEWEFGGNSKYGPTVTWEYPADRNTVSYPVSLTIYRSSGTEHDTAVTYITIPGDPFEAVINYKFIDDFTILCEADNSIGRDIVLEHCTWETEDIIGPSIQRGPTATFAFPATSKDKSYPVTLTIYNSSGQSHTALEKILINKDNLKAIVTYKGSPNQPRTIIFDAGESLGSNIDWQRCKWSFGDQSVDYGPSAIHTYPSNRNTIRYPVTLTIFRKDTGEQDTSEVKYIAITPDMPTAKTDYEFAHEMAPDGTEEDAVDLQTIICNAYLSSGDDIIWNQCTWETIIANSIVKQTGPTATFKYPPETQSRYYPITLTVTDRSGQTDSVTEFIRVDEDYLNADFTYRFEDRLVDEQNDQESGHNVTFDARSSQGAGINWTACEWTFSDGYPKQHGACITRGFSYTSEDKDIAVTLNIYRRGNEIEAASVTKHLKIIGDKLQAIIKWDVQEYTEGTEILEDGNIVSVTYIDTIILDAKSSIGHSINWDRCTWHFDNGQVKQGATVSHRFAPGDTAYMHPVLLTIYRGTADGVESDSIYTNIFIKGDPLKPVIDYQFDTDIETAEGDQGKGSGRTVLFSARNSIGRGIVWDKCRWTFGDDSNLIIFGSSASHTYYLRGEDHYYTVSLSIPRIDPESGQLIYSDPVYKKIKIEGDELEPVINYQFIEWNKVLFDATESKGQGIDRSKCRWSFGGGADQQAIGFTEGESHSIRDKNDTSSESNTLQNVVYNAAQNPVVEHYFKDPGSYLITLTIFRFDPVSRGYESATKSIVIDIVSDIKMCPDQIVTIEAVYSTWFIFQESRSCQVKLRTSPAGTSFFSSCRMPGWDNRDNSARMTCGNDGKWYVSEQKAWGYYANPYRDCVKRWPYDSFNDSFCWSCISSEVYDWL